MAVMVIFLMMQSIMNPPPEPQDLPPVTRETTSPPPLIFEPGENIPEENIPAESITDSGPAPIPEIQESGIPFVRSENIPLQQFVTIETDILTVVLTNAGGNIVSYQLKDHLDDGLPVEMIFRGNADPQAFAIAFGSRDEVASGRIRPQNENFHVRRISNHSVEFYQTFTTDAGIEFTLTKRYEFIPGEYIFELNIEMDRVNFTGAFDFDGSAYTLLFSPQIGPPFVRLDQRYEFRNYLSYRAGRMRTERVNERDITVMDNMPSWASIAGKYFTLVALPYARDYEIGFASNPEPGIPSSSRLYISIPATTSRIQDRYHIYLGPKSQEILNIYERGENHFNLRDTGLGDIADTRGFLAPLERILKWFLTFFYSLIPNYGIAIILLTILVKLAIFPLTRKGSESTLRMQALAPKMKEIQEKYKDNKQKLNQEMAEFYKKEGYNPIAGCLPMLLQMPIFFAMFNLFNTHFDLRGAMFIPGWIMDLSRPESIIDFPEGFSLPILGWTALRLLPFIYVGSQLIYGRVTQTPEQRGNNQAKIMLYVLPIVFFFVLYDMPSGLLVYWILSNILTLVQQVLISKFLVKRKDPPASIAGGNPNAPKIAPGPKRKKNK